jgi:hypothetical protein
MSLDFPDPQNLKKLLEDWFGKRTGSHAYKIVLWVFGPLLIIGSLLALVVAIHSYAAQITDWFSTTPVGPSSTIPSPASPPRPPASTPSGQPNGAKRVFTDWTIKNLRAPFKDRTVMQATEVIASQIGKWINVDGKLSAVPVSMVFWITTDNELVQCVFEDGWKTRLMPYRIKDPIRVVGKINESQVSDRLALIDCELR